MSVRLSFSSAPLCFLQSGSRPVHAAGTEVSGNGRRGARATGPTGHICLPFPDGNTAIVGGRLDEGQGAGAAWIWSRSGGAWTQGTKLYGSGAVGMAFQGSSASISADGNTAIVGGPNDNTGAGAAWVWIRNGGVWTQQSTKLVGSGDVGHAPRRHLERAARDVCGTLR
jgi:hypothetical protein